MLRFEKKELCTVWVNRNRNGRLTVVVECRMIFDGDPIRYTSGDVMEKLAAAIAETAGLRGCECGHRHWRVVSRTLSGTETAYFFLRFPGQPSENGALGEARKLITTITKAVEARDGRVHVRKLL